MALGGAALILLAVPSLGLPLTPHLRLISPYLSSFVDRFPGGTEKDCGGRRPLYRTLPEREVAGSRLVRWGQAGYQTLGMCCVTDVPPISHYLCRKLWDGARQLLLCTVRRTDLEAPPHPALPAWCPHGRIFSHLAHCCRPTLSLTLSSTRVTGEGPAVPRLL